MGDDGCYIWDSGTKKRRISGSLADNTVIINATLVWYDGTYSSSSSTKKEAPMARSIKLVVYPVTDLEKAKAFYGKLLGTKPYADGPYYVGYRDGDLEVGLDPNSTVGPIGYTEVEDIKASLEDMISVGGEVVQDAKDVGGGLLIAQVKDTDGNVIGLRQQP
jgi:predicted enzyme related to lactoylglutathione lyase